METRTETRTKKRRKTKLEIIDKIVKRYDGYPERRAVKRNYKQDVISCFYKHPQVKNCYCAVGLCMTKEVIESMEGTLSMVSPVGIFTRNDSIDHLLKEEYKGHSVVFWRSLQTLHDSDDFWDKKTGFLTEKGKEIVENMREQYTE